MKRLPFLLFMVHLFLLGSFISGCQEGSAINANIDPSLVVPVERILSKEVYVKEAFAHVDGDITKVFGKVKRSAYNCCETAKGHVDIVVLANDGVVLDFVSVLYSPRNVPRTNTKTSRFSATLPYIVPQGAIIRVTYHDSLDTVDSIAYAGGLFHCEQNMAVPEEEVATIDVP